MSDAPRIYANRTQVSVGARDAVIGLDYLHPIFIDEPEKGERVAEIVLPRLALEVLAEQIQEQLATH
jgi:hypothetical protein